MPVALVLALAVLAGCVGAPAAVTEEDRQSISAIFAQYIRTLETYDAEGWMALWDENGVQLPPNAPMFVGKDAIRAANYDGKFMTLFHKQSDGRWLIFRDCFNSNRPAQ